MIPYNYVRFHPLIYKSLYNVCSNLIKILLFPICLHNEPYRRNNFLKKSSCIGFFITLQLFIIFRFNYFLMLSHNKSTDKLS